MSFKILVGLLCDPVTLLFANESIINMISPVSADLNRKLLVYLNTL